MKEVGTKSLCILFLLYLGYLMPIFLNKLYRFGRFFKVFCYAMHFPVGLSRLHKSFTPTCCYLDRGCVYQIGGKHVVQLIFPYFAVKPNTRRRFGIQIGRHSDVRQIIVTFMRLDIIYFRHFEVRGLKRHIGKILSEMSDVLTTPRANLQEHCTVFQVLFQHINYGMFTIIGSNIQKFITRKFLEQREEKSVIYETFSPQ